MTLVPSDPPPHEPSPDEGDGEREALPLAAGQPPDGGAGERREAEAFGQLARVGRLGVHA